MRLIIHCGNFNSFDKLNIPHYRKIYQHTETDQEMLDLGTNLRPDPAFTNNQGDDHIFTNVEAVIMGIRLAIYKQCLKPNEVQLLFHMNDGKDPITIILDSDGRLSQYPEGFFGAIESALAQLL